MRLTRAAVLLAAALAAGACRRAQSPRNEGGKAAAPAPMAPASAEAGAYGLKPAEKAAVEAFLKAHTDLRMALDGDGQSKDNEMARLYGVYHAYFVRGDVNDDGRLDFVMGFVRRNSPADSPWFSVVVFSGLPDGKFDAGVFLERDISLATGDLSVDRDSIVITPDTSDDPNRRYKWDAVRGQFRFVNDGDEPAESPPLTRTGFRVSSFEFRVGDYS